MKIPWGTFAPRPPKIYIKIYNSLYKNLLHIIGSQTLSTSQDGNILQEPLLAQYLPDGCEEKAHSLPASTQVSDEDLSPVTMMGCCNPRDLTLFRERPKLLRARTEIFSDSQRESGPGRKRKMRREHRRRSTHPQFPPNRDQSNTPISTQVIYYS